MSGILHMLMSMLRLGATITIGTDSTLYGYYTGLFGSLSANAFEGKTVKITGNLDAGSKMIHVDTIQALTPEAPKN